MQVDGVGGGPWESFKESSRPPGSSARSGGQLAQRGGAAVPAVETQAALQGAALAVLLWSGGGPAREGPAAGQPWGRGWCRLRPLERGFPPAPQGPWGLARPPAASATRPVQRWPWLLDVALAPTGKWEVWVKPLGEAGSECPVTRGCTVPGLCQAASSG